MWVEDVAFDDDVVHNTLGDTGWDHRGIDMEDVNAGGGEEQPPQGLDEFHEVQRQVIEALDRGDALHEEAAQDGQIDVENDTSADTVDGLEGLYTEATAPVYPGSKMSVVSETIIIMNMCSVFRVSNTFTNELFVLCPETCCRRPTSCREIITQPARASVDWACTTTTYTLAPMDVFFMTMSMPHLIHVLSAPSHVGWMAPIII